VTRVPVPPAAPPQADLDRARAAATRALADRFTEAGWYNPPPAAVLAEIAVGAAWTHFCHTISAWHREDGR